MVPGCPLAFIFGVDPLKHYPWDYFCTFESLSSRVPCKDTPLVDSVINEIEESGSPAGKELDDEVSRL